MTESRREEGAVCGYSQTGCQLNGVGEWTTEEELFLQEKDVKRLIDLKLKYLNVYSAL